MIEYRPGSELWEYEAGSIVSGVPVRYFDNDKDAMDYRRRHQNSRFWKDNVAKLTANFDMRKFGPLYYCLKCRRLEDGAHRLIVAENKGLDAVSVQIGDICYKRYRVIKGMDILKVFHGAMDEIPTGHKLDRRWLEASANDKWPYFSDMVNFYDKSFLDVGCHVGYSCIEAWRRGAKRVLGVDIRGDVLMVAERVKAGLNIDNAVQFKRQTWRPESSEKQNFDVVMIMGLLHYFPKDQYAAILKGLCDICNDTLILELRVMGSNWARLETIGKQTLPTTTWLQGQLHRAKFLPHKRFIREKRRQLWVCERSK